MKRAIRKYFRDFIAIIVLFLISLGVGGYILSNQRLYLPKWVPLVGTDFYTLKAELQTAQAVTPGQGQTVNIAGVKVGEIAKVELKNGRALVTMKIRRKYAAVYRNASILLRPKTGLKDMILELTPGSPTTGKLPDNATIPVSSTLPDINPDEILGALDSDTRDYLRILLGSGAEGLRGQGRAVSAAFKRFEPTSRDAEKITGLLSQRRRSIARVIHNLRLISDELSTKDKQISSFVNTNNAVLAAFARQDANLRSTISELPVALQATQQGLTKADRLAKVLGPSLGALRPFARNLGPTLRQVRPVVTELTPIIRNELRPFTRQSLPVVKDLRPVLTDLSLATPDLNTVARVANYLLNELAYNPSGKEEGYLFWLTWANHLAGTVFGLQDGNGPIRRGNILLSCSSISLLAQVIVANPQLATLTKLTNLPDGTGVCPTSSAPGNTGTSPP